MRDRSCRIAMPGGQIVVGDLDVPHDPVGLVVFVHGSGSSRFSPRNRQVAGHLNSRGLATMLMDLLTGEEEARDSVTAELRFDIELLGQRVVAVIDWLELNQRAAAAMTAPVEVHVVAGAAHLFEEAGTLDEVARVTCDWLVDVLSAPAGSGGRRHL